MQMSTKPSKALVAVALLSITTASAMAAPRTDVSQLSCAQAKSVIVERGAAVVTTGPHTYKRFVSDARFCDAGNHYLHPAFTPTQDKRSCYIGYTCENWNYYFTERD
ncbi:hypothetical protein JYU29_09080 [Tianweitania sp. BSSL-BM11]|uniref:Secreted protein n=1 Tax=Tianweitania aestuarii TaxID=2814886 RepID=A0ABS5RUW6_9HYPH|nr:hypothetical protein [Tianweitania aestuarii]MBS9720838.1 hypothetical protein [Tianweitania aestuarii]